MKVNKHRFKAAPSLRDRAPRYLFDLETPDGLTLARCFAISTGIQAAVEEKKAGLNLSSEAREAGAIEAALRVEHVKHQGKRGTNDGPRFRALFYKLATRMQEAMLRYLEEEPLAYSKLATMTPAQLNHHALFTAERYVEQICSIPEDQPITMTWF